MSPGTADTSHLTGPDRIPLSELMSLLRCPCCEVSGTLTTQDEGVYCHGCATCFRVDAGVPLMLPEPRPVRVMPPDHRSNEVAESVLDWLDSVPGWTLNIGAGASGRRPARCVEFEYSIFASTSVVGDAHHLPFEDASFDAVVSYNTFEHLADPRRAAGEILRVLKPGGHLRLQTAFLQPLHEPPAHYYDATELGVRRWFDQFDVEECLVPGNMSPTFAVAWLSSVLLRHTESERGREARGQVGDTSLKYWADFWGRRFDPLIEGTPAFTVQSLSQAAQKEVAFGHELWARIPGRAEDNPRSHPCVPASNPPSLDDLAQILMCPCCSATESIATASDRQIGEGLGCRSCGHRFDVLNGVPIMLCGDRDVPVMPREHVSNPLSTEVLEWLDSFPGWTLNLGAGSTTERPARCIELEYSVFRNTSLVGDAHHLPFPDGLFDAVVSYNTFEHLEDPEQAAAELLRVTRPGGQLRVQTAFLQPLHEEPAHFYNATEFGLRRWFEGSEIEDCFVPPQMGPAHTLGWLANHILYHVGDAQGAMMERLAGQLRLSQFARFWSVPSTRSGFLRVLFDRMPERAAHFSAGFEVRARRPLTSRSS